MPAQGGESAVNLFGEHGAGKLMRKGHVRKRQQEIRAGSPFGWKPVMTSDQENKILCGPFGLAEEMGEIFGIHGFTERVEENPATRCVACEEIEAFRNDLAHLAGGEAGAALQEFRRYGVGVLIPWFSNEVQPDLHGLTCRLPGLGVLR